MSRSFLLLCAFILGIFSTPIGLFAADGVPPAWEVLPIPRFVDCGPSDAFVDVHKVAIVRRPKTMYQTLRDADGNLSGQSTIVEEELTAALKQQGVAEVQSVGDSLPSYDDYDTLIILGRPEFNAQTEKYLKAMDLSFAKLDDPRTPEKDFNNWKDFGREGYLLAVGKAKGKNVVILAGYDYDDARKQPYGAGTFYAFQSLKQLLVRDGDRVRIKTAEIADRPLVQHRGCFAVFMPKEELAWWKVRMMTAMKANAVIFWYGDNLYGYSTGAAAKFRYPWSAESLAAVSKFGRWCREHFISVNLCMNPDHYNYAWANPMTFDGKTRDPLHYNLKHPVEQPFKELWAKAGYDVNNDVDILAAKFAQMNKALHGGATLIMQNEDDVFGLVHQEDKDLFQTETPDKKQNAINYGKARAQVLIALYKRVRELAPDSSDVLPFSPPGGVTYQTPLETNEYNCRDFMTALANELKAAGLQEKMPVSTTGGGTNAEVISNKNMDDFRSWCAGAPVYTVENNFVLGRIGTVEGDPNGPRWPMQRSKDFPAGYRDRELYKRLWGIQWNMNSMWTMPVLAWGQSQYMWNMLALDKKKIDDLAMRKVCSEKSYPRVKDFYDEFRRPACYCPDDGIAPMLVVSDTVYFPRVNWEAVISYTDAMRLAAQKVYEKLGTLLPKLNADWEDELVKESSIQVLGDNAYNFCCLYLARGYIKGWEGQTPESKDLYAGDRLRDLLIEADAIQERYFNGPELILGKTFIDRNYYISPLNRLYIKNLQQPPQKVSEAVQYVDIWKEGLADKFFTPVSRLTVADAADGDPRLSGDWGKVEQTDSQKFRHVKGEAKLKLDPPKGKQLLVRLNVGSDVASLVNNPFTTDTTPSTPIKLSAGGQTRDEFVCKPRWITWLLPVGTKVSDLTLHSDSPVRVHAVELYQAKSSGK